MDSTTLSSHVNTIIGWLFLLLHPADCTGDTVLKVHPCSSLCQNILPFKGWKASHCLYLPHFIVHLSVKGHFGCFYFSAVVNKAAVNMGVQISLWDPAFNSFGCRSRCGIAGSCSHSLFMFWSTTGMILFYNKTFKNGNVGADIHVTTIENTQKHTNLLRMAVERNGCEG